MVKWADRTYLQNINIFCLLQIESQTPDSDSFFSLQIPTTSIYQNSEQTKSLHKWLCLDD